MDDVVRSGVSGDVAAGRVVPGGVAGASRVVSGGPFSGLVESVGLSGDVGPGRGRVRRLVRGKSGVPGAAVETSTALPHRVAEGFDLSRCHGVVEGSGLQCGLPAGSGTRHVGFGLCRFHGGSSVEGELQGSRLRAEALVSRVREFVVLPVDVEPGVALQNELGRSVAMVEWLEAFKLSAEGGLVCLRRSKDGEVLVPSLWVDWWHRERENVVRLAALVSRLGLEERRVLVREVEAKVFALALGRLLDGLGLDEVQRSRVPGLVRGVFSELDGSVVSDVSVGVGVGVLEGVLSGVSEGLSFVGRDVVDAIDVDVDFDDNDSDVDDLGGV